MAAPLLSLLFVCILSINPGTAQEETYIPDFRPSATSPNSRIHKVHTDCQAAYDDGWRQSGLYTISPHGAKQIDVLCEQTLNGGWTVFQKRVDGQEDFYLTWRGYQIGFGDLRKEFWIGLDNLHYLTSHNDKMLKVELQDGNLTAYADYSSFMLESVDTNYVLRVSGFSDTDGAGDSLLYHNGSPFTTKDMDNDANVGNCAQLFSGAWWYASGCHMSNLNGLYGSDIRGQGINWKTWRGFSTSLSGTRMMIKRK